jgi:hypothetical protein
MVHSPPEQPVIWAGRLTRRPPLLWRQTGIPTARAGRLRLQPLVRAVPRLGRPVVTDDAPGASGRRTHAGQTIDLIDGRTGEIRPAQIGCARQSVGRMISMGCKLSRPDFDVAHGIGLLSGFAGGSAAASPAAASVRASRRDTRSPMPVSRMLDCFTDAYKGPTAVAACWRTGQPSLAEGT